MHSSDKALPQYWANDHHRVGQPCAVVDLLRDSPPEVFCGSSRKPYSDTTHVNYFVLDEFFQKRGEWANLQQICSKSFLKTQKLNRLIKVDA